ncbi:MAG: glycosyltransferase, partial [Phormidesmis sp.]
MRILMGHNYYQQPGGEGQVFAAECALLESEGHQVFRYTLHNDEMADYSAQTMAVATLWHHRVYKEIRSLIQQKRIQIAHFHNTFPLISSAAYYAAQAEGIPVIQTMHNYRLLCPNALFFRDGKVCEDCLGQPIPWPGVVHRCYRESAVASGAVATMLTAHRVLNTWTSKVTKYIVLTEFARDKFIQGGLPASKIVIKPNFVETDPGYQLGEGNYALYVGRLSVEKGLDVLLKAW